MWTDNTRNAKIKGGSNTCIHVNPPSFVRSLRHFGIVENLRPGDENLRHLTVTSIFEGKKVNILAITTKKVVKTQPNCLAAASLFDNGLTRSPEATMMAIMS